jgi:hypothetical protein
MYDVNAQADNYFTITAFFPSDHGGALHSALRRLWAFHTPKKLEMADDGTFKVHYMIHLSHIVHEMRQRGMVPANVTDSILVDGLHKYHMEKIAQALVAFDVPVDFRIEIALDFPFDGRDVQKAERKADSIEPPTGTSPKKKKLKKKKAKKKVETSHDPDEVPEDEDDDRHAPSDQSYACQHCGRPFSEHQYDPDYAADEGVKRYLCPEDHRDKYEPHWYNSWEEFFEIVCPKCNKSTAEGNSFEVIEVVRVWRNYGSVDSDNIQENQGLYVDGGDYSNDDEDSEEVCVNCNNCGRDVGAYISVEWT